MQSHWVLCGGSCLGNAALPRSVIRSARTTAISAVSISFTGHLRVGESRLGSVGDITSLEGARREAVRGRAPTSSGRMRYDDVLGSPAPRVSVQTAVSSHTGMTVAEVSPERAEHEIAVRALRLLKARQSPCFFLQFVLCVDAKTGEEFSFDLLTAEERDLIDLKGKPGLWFWHRPVLDSWQAQEVSLEYKARQIGVTWL